MTTVRHFLIIISALAVSVISGPATAGEISISAEVSAASMAFEAKDTLTINLIWEGDPFQYQIDEFPMPTLEKMEILGSSSSVATSIDSTVAAGEITTRTFRYILQPTDYGTGVISPLNLTAKDRVSGEAHDLQTGRLTVEIARPVPKPEPGSNGAVLFAIIAGVVIVIGGGAVVLLLKRRRPVEEKPVDLGYLESLREIKKETVADRKLFYSRLYRLLLSYLEKERGLDVSSKTGEEVIRTVGELDDDAERAGLMQWINLAQKVKYRPEAPSAGDVENTYNAVYQFFESKLHKG